MGKIKIADCVAYINTKRPGKWKCTLKKGNEKSVVREFQAVDVPGVKAIVGELDGAIAFLRFETQEPEIKDPKLVDPDTLPVSGYSGYRGF